MIKIADDQRRYLEQLIPNIQELIDKDSDEDLLLAIDDLIMDEYDDAQNTLSDRGIALQKLYDEIFEAND